MNALYAVMNADNTYAGAPCTSYEEAKRLASQKEGRWIAELVYVNPELEQDDTPFTCQNCSYWYAEEEDEYPHCHYDDIFPAPCELDE